MSLPSGVKRFVVCDFAKDTITLSALFSNLSGREVPVSFMLQKDFWQLVGALFLVGALLSGFYPAVVLSSFKPVSVLKGKVMRTAQGNILRKGLVVFQFASSVGLIRMPLRIGSVVRWGRSLTVNETASLSTSRLA